MTFLAFYALFMVGSIKAILCMGYRSRSLLLRGWVPCVREPYFIRSQVATSPRARTDLIRVAKCLWNIASISDIYALIIIIIIIVMKYLFTTMFSL